MAEPIRRVRATQASARGAAAKVSVTDERGHGFVSASVRDTRQKGSPPYYENSREVEVLRQRFTEDNPAAFVRVGAGLTINLDNFESLRIDCAVTIPCQRGSLDEAYQLASDFVSDKIAEEQTTWLGQAQFSKGKGR